MPKVEVGLREYLDLHRFLGEAQGIIWGLLNIENPRREGAEQWLAKVDSWLEKDIDNDG